MGHTATWESEQKKKIAGFIAVDSLARQSCVYHLGSLFRGAMPSARAEALARRRYLDGALYSSFSSIDDLTTHVRQVLRESDWDQCEICLRIEQEREALENAVAAASRAAKSSNAGST